MKISRNCEPGILRRRNSTSKSTLGSAGTHESKEMAGGLSQIVRPKLHSEQTPIKLAKL